MFNYINKNKYLCMILTILVVLGSLAFRTAQVSNTTLFHPNLWAEDGNVFFNQAKELGLLSVIKPYAGYIHFIPRLVAYASVHASPFFTPLIFHCAWLLSFLFSIFLISKRLLENRVHKGIIFWVLILMTLQPQAGEVYFSLTNIQWFTGIAIFTYLAFPIPDKVTKLDLSLLLIGGLTGPFCALAIPLILLRLFLFKDYLKYKSVYLIVFLSTFIQVIFQIISPKIFMSAGGHYDIHTWLVAILRFLTFGFEHKLATTFSLLFWIAFPWGCFIALWKNRKNSYFIKTDKRVYSALFFIVAIELMAVGFLRDNIQVISPIMQKNGVAGGSRYYVIPYTLLLIGLALSSTSYFKKIIFVLMSFSVISYVTFTKPLPSRQQWGAYVNLASKVPNLFIPINPRTNDYPGWAVDASGFFIENKKTDFTLVPLDTLDIVNGQLRNSTGHMEIDSNSDNFSIKVSINKYCQNSKTLGIALNIDRSSPGWVQALWAKDNAFDDYDSVLQYYPVGNVIAYLAFERKSLNQDSLLIRTSFVKGIYKVKELKVYCLSQ